MSRLLAKVILFALFFAYLRICVRVDEASRREASRREAGRSPVKKDLCKRSSDLKLLKEYYLVSFFWYLGIIKLPKTHLAQIMFKMELLESDAAGKFTRFQLQHRHIGAIAALILISLLSSLTGSPADHTILNCWEGLLWGLANPVIGLDCLTVIFAIGLLSAVVVRGAAIARCFFLATLLGMMIHLLQLNLPGVEIAIAISVIAFGRMLISNHLNFVILVLLGVCAGLFQGYVGTKDIVDAETITIVTYILGFSLTQFAVVMSAREIFRTTNISTKKIRLAGFAYCALGVVFLGNLVL